MMTRQFRMALFSGLTAFLLVIAAVEARGEALSAADQAAIIEVIGSQMEAFQRDDAESAFAFAAPSIRSRFQSADVFMQMVATGYHPVYRPKSVKFLDVVTKDGSILQRVWIESADGTPVIAVYIMAKQPGGSWRIRGVHLVEPDGTGV